MKKALQTLAMAATVASAPAAHAGDGQFQLLVLAMPTKYHYEYIPIARDSFEKLAKLHAFDMTWTAQPGAFEGDLSKYAAVVLLNLVALGFLNLSPDSPEVMRQAAVDVMQDVTQDGLPHAIAVLTIGVASCVLAYSGIESVIQTAGLVEGWRDISKAYWFLALTVGIVTPLISALALSAPLDVHAHEGDLIANELLGFGTGRHGR